MVNVPGEALRPATTLPDLRRTRPWARALAVAVYVALLVAVVAVRGIPSDAVQIFLWLWLATIAWNIEAPPKSHLAFPRDWWIPLALLVFYFYSRGLADEVIGVPVHWQMPITVDEWMGGGELPTILLQEAWCGNPCDPASDPRWYDLFFTLTYTSHFLVGLTLAMVLWMTNRVEWKKWMRRYVGLNLVGLVIYITYPMAPPWMASDEGLTGQVERLTSRGWSETGLSRYHAVLTGVGNPVAAMPSLHAGTAFLVAFYAIYKLRSNWRWVVLLYPMLMSLGLVYDGEHYVIDIIAGAAVAYVVHRGSLYWERIRGD